MDQQFDRRKRVRHYDDPRDVHELTFSCFDRRPLLNSESARQHLAECIEIACVEQGFCLTAFVFMPEHVHLLVFPSSSTCGVSRLLAAIKRPCSVRIKDDLVARDEATLRSLTVRERPGKYSFRFWQEGSGYDRNLTNAASVLAAIDYIHLNPVRRNLCNRAIDWCWSSARFYLSSGDIAAIQPIRLTRLPVEFFD